jgi:hypothetical protein
MDCYEILLEWIQSEQDKFTDDDMKHSELVAYTTLELVKRKIKELNEKS